MPFFSKKFFSPGKLMKIHIHHQIEHYLNIKFTNIPHRERAQNTYAEVGEGEVSDLFRTFIQV
jgi:hypothetical protein